MSPGLTDTSASICEKITVIRTRLLQSLLIFYSSVVFVISPGPQLGDWMSAIRMQISTSDFLSTVEQRKGGHSGSY